MLAQPLAIYTPAISWKVCMYHIPQRYSGGHYNTQMLSRVCLLPGSKDENMTIANNKPTLES
jgi:hypothetical protein